MCGSIASFITTGNLPEGQGTSFRTGMSLAAGASQVFCIPLLSGIVGVLHNKFLPTGDMSAGDLWLANAADGIVGDTART